MDAIWGLEKCRKFIDREKCIVEAPVSEVAALIDDIERMPEWDTHVKESKILEQLGPNLLIVHHIYKSLVSIHLFYDLSKLPIQKPRDFVFVRCSRLLSNGVFVFMGCSVDHKDAPETKVIIGNDDV